MTFTFLALFAVAIYLAWPTPPRRLTTRPRVRIIRGAYMGRTGLVVDSRGDSRLVAMPGAGRWWYHRDDLEVLP
jgi:hypothetical protein